MVEDLRRVGLYCDAVALALGSCRSLASLQTRPLKNAVSRYSRIATAIAHAAMVLRDIYELVTNESGRVVGTRSFSRLAVVCDRDCEVEDGYPILGRERSDLQSSTIYIFMETIENMIG